MRKLKKALSLSLALVLSLAMAVPAFAASTLTGNQLNPAGSWGNGPSLTLTGVVAERPAEMDFPVCYDVEVGGSLEMEMPYPAGKNRAYTIMVAGTYVSPDLTDYLDNGQDWDVPKESEGGLFDASSGKTKYVYHFTEADMGQLNGYDKVIYPMISWDEAKDPNADYADDSGHVYFCIRVVPAKSTTQPEQPTTPAQPEKPTQPTTPVQPEKPAQPVTPAAPGSYTVKKGDTWSSICTNFYGTNAQRGALQKANKNVKLKEGAVITLPEKLGKAALIPAPAAAAGEKLYTVKAGDTLGKIAKAEYGQVSAYKSIFQRNTDRLKNANTIYEGQVIVLPAKK